MIVRIEREFSGGGFIRRLKAPVDGPAEGSFLACSCWLADCMSMQGRHDDARAQFERVLAVRNDADCWQKSATFPAAIFPATSRGRFRISPSSDYLAPGQAEVEKPLAKPDATRRPGNATDADDNVSLF
ncbi:hypothetical protein WCQ02_37710 [Paraburkholderia tropica]|nr:hypothetical protein [Paraburkholderia tropica]